MSTSKYRYVGIHPESLANGRPVEPGEFVDLSDDDFQDPHNEMLLLDGNLIEAVEPPPEEEQQDSPEEETKSSKKSGGSTKEKES